MFAWRRNRLATHFSECIPIVKQCISVLMDYSFGSDKAAAVSAAAQGVLWKGSTNVCHQWDASISKCMGTIFNGLYLITAEQFPNGFHLSKPQNYGWSSLNTCEMMECLPRLLATCHKKRDGCEGQASFLLFTPSYSSFRWCCHVYCCIKYTPTCSTNNVHRDIWWRNSTEECMWYLKKNGNRV